MMMLNKTSLLILAAAGLLAANASAAESQAEKAQKLVAVLQSNAPLFDKARACQQLGEFGDKQAVPALAALLADEHLGAYARSGLEGIPDPSAAAALRTAAGTLKGNPLIGVVNSLGVLRDTEAVGRLKQLAADPESGAAREALLALGRIGTGEAIATITQFLATGPDQQRDDAAAAGLLAAEKKLADGQPDGAVVIYDGVRSARVSPPYLAAATRGAIVARKADGVALLIEQLRSPERLLQNVALLTIREIPSDALAAALNVESGRAPVEMRIQLIAALADCHNAQSLQVLRDHAAGEDVGVRKAALTVLGRIGGPAEVGTLLAAVAANRSAGESALALESLGRMEAAGVDEQIIKALATAADAGLRVKIIRLMESRGTPNAAGELLKQAAGADVAASVAALRALKTLAGPGEVPALIALTKSSKDETVRAAGVDAVVGAGTRTGKGAEVGEAVLAELRQATDPAVKNAWINILVALGHAKALPAILAAVQDAQESVAANAIEQLSRWPDPAPVEDLLAVMQTNPAQRRRALASVIRLATTAAEEHQRPDAVVVQWFQRASQAAQTAPDRRLIISGLGRVKHIESFRLLAPYLDNADLQGEAALAIVQIAPALRQEDPAALKEALEKIVATAKTDDLRNRAAKLSAAIPSQAKRTALFDGRSLAGWEGDTNVWRVRDGVIVGGSMNGNPRNEFLATVKSYSNFVLRLEYRLTGTAGFVNGGVQFRSVRTKVPPSEMSGYQADIGAGYSGCLYDESRRNKFLVQPANEQIKRLEKPGEWNRYEVRCAGARIQIVLNGEKTVDYIEPDPAMALDGLIALQIHGDCKAEIAFRNLTIEELSYGVATREFGLPKSRWKVLSFSSENTAVEDERAVLAIDDNPETFWHTRWNGASPGHPHHLAVDLTEEVEITGFTYLTRQDGRHVKGGIGDYELFVSRDGKDWGQPVVRGRFDGIDVDASGRVVILTRPVTARYFKIVSLNAPGNEPYAGAAEIGVMGKPAGKSP